MAAASTFFEDESAVDVTQFRLPEVELLEKALPSNEENEDAVFERICKLFRFREGEWKERAKGNVRIMKHKVSGAMRVIIREAASLYVRANHFVDPSSPLTVPDGDSTGKRFRFGAADFSDAALTGSHTMEQFLIFFRTAEDAAEFKEAHDAAREVNKTALGKATGGAAAAPAAAAASAAAVDESGSVPESTDLSELWGDSDEEVKRLDAMTAAFTARFGAEPEFFVRAPGRVNVIGEHIDYHNFSVLPFALRQDIVFAVATDVSTSGVEVSNTSDAFADATLPADPNAAVDSADGVKWQHYFQAGYKAAFGKMGDATAPRGMRVLVDGRVPPGGGVSSSSAMSVGSCLATLKAHGHTLSRAQLAEAAQKAEAEAVGTMSGGMDQAICAMGVAGQAMRVNFSPLTVAAVNIPSSVSFVVANCLESSEKAVGPEQRYNKRVTEGLLATKLIAKKAGLDQWKSINDMRALMRALALAGPGDLAGSVEANLKEGPYTVAELEDAAEFGEPLAAVLAECAQLKLAKAVVAAEGATFELRKRARHVATEAQRVLDFAAACAGEHTADTVAELGALMDESHSSCRDDYECSSDALDRLVGVAKAAGAKGARLTGAGWGGCIVAMVDAGKEADVIAAMDADFYADKSEEVRSQARFASAPASGAAVYVVDNDL
ncbi:hypothetical protein FNF29_01574 [Cafeteria roenbergensis]|uniref:RanBD1 domain-containing protein n=1 Tax=Cafeteria roenbergensis TaxID=33653 RepID=A0A5A8CSK9_CAFRO|nr:hypothetical protein FNF29_01574 [Cafeteria roenbergensis]|eukprot:KAA0155659.1 hypothetical protein FNF29_01574 [Cafeteria roenbergensis]